MASVLDHGQYNCRLSSVLNKDVKQFGKEHLFDGNEETCWNSDQGSPQWIELSLEKEEVIDAVLIQFQGGFVGRNCTVDAKKESGEHVVEPFYPEDINSLQTFTLKQPLPTKRVKIIFNESTDFFGRIIIYKLDILRSGRC